GRVIVQTRAPGHHAIRAAAHHSVAEFAAAELPLRAPPQPAYPPHLVLARFLAAAPEEASAQRAAERVAAWLRRPSAENVAGAPSPARDIRRLASRPTEDCRSASWCRSLRCGRSGHPRNPHGAGCGGACCAGKPRDSPPRPSCRWRLGSWCWCSDSWWGYTSL